MCSLVSLSWGLVSADQDGKLRELAVSSLSASYASRYSAFRRSGQWRRISRQYRGTCSMRQSTPKEIVDTLHQDMKTDHGTAQEADGPSNIGLLPDRVHSSTKRRKYLASERDKWVRLCESWGWRARNRAPQTDRALVKNNTHALRRTMMEWTDRHCRFFHRQAHRRAVFIPK